MVQKLTSILQKVENKADNLVLPYMRENMRGLGTFISDIRNCKSKEAEQKRVNKELVHIRQKFKNERTIDPYSRRKYIAKLLFIHLLGHEVNFGHVEAGGLIGSPKYQDKQIGYLFLSVLYCDDSDMNRMLMNSLINDLQSSNPNFILLALQCLTYLINPKIVEDYGSVLLNLMKTHSNNDSLMRTALLCYSAMFRKCPSFLTSNSETNNYLISLAQKTQNYALLLQYVSVFFQASIISPEVFSGSIPIFINALDKLVSNSAVEHSDNLYYQIPSPWTQIKIMQFLMLYPPIDSHREIINSICNKILKKRFDVTASNKIHFLNTRAAISFEAINLIIHYDLNVETMEEAVKCLASYLIGKDVNFRYLSLEILSRISSNERTVNLIKPFTDVILKVVTDEKDTSVRLQAVDVIYLICNTQTAKIVIPELLKFLNTAEVAIRHELSLKIAFIAEKYVENHQWYLDTMMTLVQLAGNYISEDLWFRIVQILANMDTMQHYAANKAFILLKSANTNETTIKLASYILGEYGNMIANDPNSSPSIQLQLLISVFYFVDSETKAIILTSMAKMYNLYPEIKEHILSFFKTDQICCNIDVEIQQRVFEFLTLAKYPSEFIATILEIMPPYSLPELSDLLINKIHGNTIKNTTIDSHQTQNKEDFSSTTQTQSSSATTNAQKSDTIVTTNLLDDLFSDNPSTVTDPNTLTYTTSIVDSHYHYIDATNTTQSLASAAVHNISAPITLSSLYTSYQMNSDDLKNHVYTNSGKIYSDQFLNASLQAAYKSHLGRFELSIISRSSSDFTISNIEFLHHDGMAIELINKNVLSFDSTNGYAVFNFQVALLDQIEFLPTISFMLNGTNKVSFPLPIYLHKFIENYNLDAQRFFSVWQSLTEVDLASQLSVYPKNSSSIQDINNIIAKINFQLLSGVESNPNAIAASGILNTANGTVGIVLKVEPSVNGKLISVRASRPKVASLVAITLSALI